MNHYYCSLYLNLDILFGGLFMFYGTTAYLITIKNKN